jgi:hypothetical protein
MLSYAFIWKMGLITILTGKLREAFLFWVSELIAIFLTTFAIKKLPCKFLEGIPNVAKY